VIERRRLRLVGDEPRPTTTPLVLSSLVQTLVGGRPHLVDLGRWEPAEALCGLVVCNAHPERPPAETDWLADLRVCSGCRAVAAAGGVVWRLGWGVARSAGSNSLRAAHDADWHDAWHVEGGKRRVVGGPCRCRERAST
jgi:hypothetical protein